MTALWCFAFGGWSSGGIGSYFAALGVGAGSVGKWLMVGL
jgi:hypothetical protein